MNLKNLSYPLEKITKKKPLNITSIDEGLFQSKYNDTLLKVDPVEVKNCYILPNGYLFKNFTLNKNQINLWIGNKNLFKLYIKSFFSIFGIRKSDRIKKGIFVTNSNSTNFFHWFLDVLQKLEFIEGISDFDLDIIIPYSHNENYKINSLNAFNLKFYHQKKNQILFFDEIIVLPDVGDTTGNYRKSLVVKLRDRLRDYWSHKISAEKNKKKIYITRKNAEKRRIVNEEKILPFLKKNNFLILDFDLINFDEQIKYILDCEILISMHGAGLTHMLWMEKKSKILEIRPRDSKDNCYYSLASDLDHDYYYSFADRTNSKKSNTSSDFFIDEQHFIKQIKKFL